MIFRPSLCLLTLGIAASTVHAEPMYVIDQLVVSVTSDAGGEGERVGQVKSGDKLELIEREGDEAHVRLPSGKEGWVKGSYLSAEEPLANRLSERVAEIEKLKHEGEQLKQDVAHLQSELAAARVAHNTPPAAAPLPAAGSAAAAATASAPAASAPSARTPAPTSAAESAADPAAASPSPAALGTPVRETLFLRSPDRPSQTTWSFLLGLSAVMLLLGFVIGWKTLDRRIRSKYGGLRIY